MLYRIYYKVYKKTGVYKYHKDINAVNIEDLINQFYKYVNEFYNRCYFYEIVFIQKRMKKENFIICESINKEDYEKYLMKIFDNNHIPRID